MPIFYAVRLIYIPFSSLHRLFQELAELVDSLIVSFTDVIDNTGLDVGGEELLVKGVQARLDGGDLGQNIRAVAVVLDHLFDAVDLAFNPVQAVRERTYLLRRPWFMLVAAISAAAAGRHILFYCVLTDINCLAILLPCSFRSFLFHGIFHHAFNLPNCKLSLLDADELIILVRDGLLNIFISDCL